jgi:hypothetical protein
MHNWSVDTQNLKKYPEKYAIWKLEQLINFGLDGEKLDLFNLKKYFNRLQISSNKKKYLEFLLSN